MTDGVTIAIPNWNHEVLLPRSIRSALRSVAVLREQGVAGEVLVVDDCSRDGSVALLRGLEARHHRDGLRVLARAANGGLAAARNLALANARYRHVAFLDADNELVPENLPTVRRALIDTGAAGAYGNLLARTLSSRAAYGAVSNESIQARMFAENYVDAFALFDRAQLLDVNGYEASCPAWEDYALWLHLITSGRVVTFVPVVLGYYYTLPNSMLAEAADAAKHRALRGRVERMFDQLKVRGKLPLTARHVRYHPALGAL